MIARLRIMLIALVILAIYVLGVWIICYVIQ